MWPDPSLKIENLEKISTFQKFTLRILPLIGDFIGHELYPSKYLVLEMDLIRNLAWECIEWTEKNKTTWRSLSIKENNTFGMGSKYISMHFRSFANCYHLLN